MHIDNSKRIRDQGVEGRPRANSDADDEGDEWMGWDGTRWLLALELELALSQLKRAKLFVPGRSAKH